MRRHPNKHIQAAIDYALKAMQEFRFCVILNEEMSDDLAEALFEAGCDDGTCSQLNGLSQVRFGRDAESLETAIRSAVSDVLKAGCTVKRVQIDADSPLLAGLSRNSD